MLRRHILTLSLLPFVFGGCAVGPDYKTPETQSPEAWRVEAPADVPSIANLPWWEVFQEPELQQLIQTALAGNKELRMALERLEQARAVLGGSGAAFLPSVGYSGSAFRSDPAGGAAPNPHGFSFGGNVQWELDLWGRVRRQHESATAQYHAVAESKNAVVLALVSEIATGYFRLCSLDAQLALAGETLKTRQESLDLAQLKYDKGTGNEIDVLRFKAELITARTSITKFKQAVSAQENALSLLTGRNPGAIARRSGARQAAPVLAQVPAGLPSELLLRRPDVRAAEKQVRAANAQIGAAVANYFPKVSLTGVLGFFNPKLADLFESGSMTQQGGGSLLGPIFNGGAIYYSVKQAEARTRETVAAYEQTVLNAFREVNDAIVALQSSRVLITDLEEQVAALAGALEKIRRGTESGLFSKLPELDADRALFAVQLQLADARLNDQMAAVQLYKALGGGWNTGNPENPLVNAKGEIVAGPGK